MSTSATIFTYEPWPALPYNEFKPTAYLLQRTMQAIGKLKLKTPFEPHWGNVALWVTSRGLTTGAIPFALGSFSVDVDFINHKISCYSSWGQYKDFPLTSTSVADLTKTLFITLHSIGVEMNINLMPQEVPNPISFDQDTEIRPYNAALANAWWRIIVSTHRVLKRYHAKFQGITPPVGLMWGTFDIRDARYKGTPLPLNTDINIIERNAFDDVQVEAGWWSGSEQYPKPAFFSLPFPTPEGIENKKIQPAAAKWDETLKEFLLDYDDLRQAKNPDERLLDFFESSYQAAAELQGWDMKLIGAGKAA